VNSWIALLRGINVGGRNTLPMKDLVELLAKLGCVDVLTYIQSGNAVFTPPDVAPERLGRSVANGIEASFGFKPDVVILDCAMLATAAADNPFSAAEANPKTLHLFFTQQLPDREAPARLEILRADSERFQLRGRVLYLEAPGGVGRSRLVKNVDKALGTPATGRNWRTVAKLLELTASQKKGVGSDVTK
jgi:uncharacterized protein (DUF1697 family)